MGGLSSALGSGLLLALATTAHAHGGQYRSPVAPKDPDPGVPGRDRARTGGDWADWWWSNRERYIEAARRRLHEARRATRSLNGGLGPMSLGGAVPPPEPEAEDDRAFHERVVLPDVLRAFREGEAEVRSAAAVALGKMAFPRSLPDLEKGLRDPHPDVRDGALLALGMLRDELALEPLRGVLHDPSVRERTRGFAALGIGLVGGERAAALLGRFLSPASDAERQGGLQKTDDLLACVVLALGHTRSAAAAAELRRLYATQGLLEDLPRACASISLARLGDRESIPLLLKGLRHREDALRQCAAVALGILGRPEDAATIAALSKAASADGDEATRRFALAALGRIGGAPGREALRPFLENPAASEDRTYVLLALGISGDLASAPLLRRAFREDGALRGPAAIALGILGDREAAPDLREAAFGKGDAVLRSHCITALGLLGDEAAVPSLRALVLEDGEPRLRLAAAVSLGILGDPAAVPPVAALARKGTTQIGRAHACYFLGVLGGREAARTLVDAAADSREAMVVRMHAVAGLGVLADPSPVPLLAGLGVDGNHLLGVDPIVEVASFL
jgi:HEAT repeat protein